MLRRCGYGLVLVSAVRLASHIGAFLWFLLSPRLLTFLLRLVASLCNTLCQAIGFVDLVFLIGLVLTTDKGQLPARTPWTAASAVVQAYYSHMFP
jgi:hypothetical protein